MNYIPYNNSSRGAVKKGLLIGIAGLAAVAIISYFAGTRRALKYIPGIPPKDVKAVKEEVVPDDVKAVKEEVVPDKFEGVNAKTSDLYTGTLDRTVEINLQNVIFVRDDKGNILPYGIVVDPKGRPVDLASVDGFTYSIPKGTVELHRTQLHGPRQPTREVTTIDQSVTIYDP